MDGMYNTRGETRNAYKTVVGESQGLLKTYSRWKDNIEMDPAKIGCQYVKWIQFYDTV